MAYAAQIDPEQSSANVSFGKHSPRLREISRRTAPITTAASPSSNSRMSVSSAMRSLHFDGRVDAVPFATETPVGRGFQQRELASNFLARLPGSFQCLLRIGSQFRRKLHCHRDELVAVSARAQRG